MTAGSVAAAHWPHIPVTHTVQVAHQEIKTAAGRTAFMYNKKLFSGREASWGRGILVLLVAVSALALLVAIGCIGVVHISLRVLRLVLNLGRHFGWRLWLWQLAKLKGFIRSELVRASPGSPRKSAAHRWPCDRPLESLHVWQQCPAFFQTGRSVHVRHFV